MTSAARSAPPLAFEGRPSGGRPRVEFAGNSGKNSGFLFSGRSKARAAAKKMHNFSKLSEDSARNRNSGFIAHYSKFIGRTSGKRKSCVIRAGGVQRPESAAAP